jgi:transposase
MLGSDLIGPGVLTNSSYFEGRTCPLARRGYSRDGRRDKLQIVFGLLCSSGGVP